MKESYRKGVASHPGPESCVASRKAAIEALTGGSAGRVLSCEIIANGVPTPFIKVEGNTGGHVIASIRWTPRSLRPLACMETPRAGTGRPHRRPTCNERWAGWRPQPKIRFGFRLSRRSIWEGRSLQKLYVLSLADTTHK